MVQKETLEAKLADGVRFLVIVTLQSYRPGVGSGATPELFNFGFAQRRFRAPVRK
jgi:hypothetical protein